MLQHRGWLSGSASSTIAPAAITSGLPAAYAAGTLTEVAEIAQRERVDHLYVTLPLEEHAKLLDLMEITSASSRRQGGPDILQFIALARVSRNLDGLPISTSTKCRFRASTPG